MQGNVKPLGDRVLVERLDGDGREQVSKGGIILPAHDASLRHGNSKRVPDTFRARVLVVSVEAARLSQGELAAGREVLVHTYDNNDPDSTLAGEATRYGMLVRLDDIIGVVEDGVIAGDRSAFRAHETNACIAIFKASRLSKAHEDARQAAHESAPLLGMIPKRLDWKDVRPDGQEDPRAPQAIESLGFHRKSGF